jgi:hypothetical protein
MTTEENAESSVAQRGIVPSAGNDDVTNKGGRRSPLYKRCFHAGDRFAQVVFVDLDAEEVHA